MNHPVRPFHLPGEHEAECLQDRVARALDDWCGAWAAAGIDPAVRVEAGTGVESEATVWTQWSGAAGRLWIADITGPAAVRAVLGSIFDPLDEVGDAWSRAVLARAMGDRDRRLAVALLGDVVSATCQPPAVDLKAAGSGAVRIVCEAIDLLMLADSGVLRHVPPRARHAAARPPLVPLATAATNAKVRLTVELGRVELDVARLLELRPGDVVCLPTRLSDRLPVLLDHAPIAQGALGHYGRQKAVQLLLL